MRRLGPEEWAGFTMLALCAAIGTPVLLGHGETRIPLALWGFLFVGMIATLLVAASTEVTRPRTARITYAASVILGWAVVFTAARSGMLLILLVLTAAMGSYIVSFRVTMAVVLLNTVVICATTAQLQVADSEVVLLTVLYLLIQVASVLSSAAILREQRMRRELAEAHVELRAASVMLAESTRSEERLRIARELHDLIGHQLTVLTLELETARHHKDPGEHVERADRVARDLLADVRRTVDGLRTEPIELRTALEAVVRDVPSLRISLHIDDDVRAYEEQAMALVRSVQEIVTNTIRHAAASSLRIDVRSTAEGVELTAVDDGRGTPDLQLGNGLRGLRERVVALGGHARFDGRHGFRVSALVPPQ
ncbi:histidine kinase [Nocardioides sp. AE5]|uniref:sensor histidine kinase n=1 Tax=Nocardioides sp. AE5 TaxID=2962573 RepID=UPI002881A5BC|nr:histidine kinase [Nocardioides sp. AE5]MDT0203438.1 histidine kinase [Nocardioides sp. AE5]